MPITFQPASPMAPDIVSAAGAAEQWSKDAPMLARMYESAQSGQTQASIASAHNATQMNAAQLSESGRDSQAANMLQEHARQFDESRLPSQADAFHAQAAMAQQQQHAELQNWLGQQQMSHAEMLDYQRTQNSIGYINQAMQSGEIDPDTGKALLMQVRTKLDPMQKRVEMGKAKLEQAQAEKAMHDVARQEKMVSMNQAERARDFHSRTVTEVDPATGESHFGWINDKGNFEPFKGATDKADSEALNRLITIERHAMDMGMKQQKADMDAWDKKRQATIDAGKDDPGPMPGKSDVGTYAKAYLDDVPGYAELKAKLGGRGKTQQQPGATNPPPTNPQGGMGQVPPPGAGPQSAPGEDPPFAWGKPVTPTQKFQTEAFDRKRAAISRRTDDLPEKMRWQAEDAVSDLKDILSRWGSFENPKISDYDKERIKKARATLKELPPPAPPADAYANPDGPAGSY